MVDFLILLSTHEVKQESVDQICRIPALRVLAGSCGATQCLKGARQERSSSIFLQGSLKKQTSIGDGSEGLSGLRSFVATPGSQQGSLAYVD